MSTQFRTLDGRVVNSHQYSVTHFERDLETGTGGSTAEGLQLQHGVNGLPGECSFRFLVRTVGLIGPAGVFFSYEISPIQVAHRETRQSFAHFLTSYAPLFYFPGLASDTRLQNMCHRRWRAHRGFYLRQRTLRDATQLQEGRRGRTCQWQADVSFCGYVLYILQ